MSYRQNALKEYQTLNPPKWKRAPLPSHVFTDDIKKAEAKIISCPNSVKMNAYESPEEPWALDENFIQTLGRPFITFAESHFKNGVHLVTNKNTVNSQPVHIKHIYLEDSFAVESQFFHILPSEHLTLILEYQSENEFSTHHGLTRIHAEAGSVVDVVRFQNLGEEGRFFDNMYFQVDEGAQVRFFDCQLGSRYKAVAMQADLKGRHSQFEVYSAYLGFENDLLDLSYMTRHYGSPTNSRILGKGALDGNAKKTFRGTLDFQRGSSQSVGQEEEFVLILDPRVNSDSLPALMCKEDDVIGEHAASVGRIDTDMLFYMMSRGLNDSQARLALVKASVAETLNDIPVSSVKEEITSAFETRLLKNQKQKERSCV